MNYNKPKITDLVTTKMPIGVSAMITKEVLEELTGLHRDHVLRIATLESRDNFLGDKLIVEMRSFLLKSEHTEKTFVSISVPKTWWDHLKQDLCNSRRRWVQHVGFMFTPPEYRSESKEVETTIRVCPHNDSYLSEKPEVHIQFMTWEDADGPR